MFLPHLFSGILCFSFVYEFLLPNLLSSFINRPKIHLSWVNQIYSWRIFRIGNEYRRRFKGDCEQTKPFVNSSFAHALTQFLSFLIYCYHHSFIKGQNCHSKLIDAVHLCLKYFTKRAAADQKVNLCRNQNRSLSIHRSFCQFNLRSYKVYSFWLVLHLLCELGLNFLGLLCLHFH